MPPTNTPVPTNTPETAGAKAVANVRLSSSQAGVLEVSWDAPPQTPRDYRIAWAKLGENLKIWTDSSGNAFPTSPSYTISGLLAWQPAAEPGRHRHGVNRFASAMAFESPAVSVRVPAGARVVAVKLWVAVRKSLSEAIGRDLPLASPARFMPGRAD